MQTSDPPPVLDEHTAAHVAELFSAFSDTSRVRILFAIVETQLLRDFLTDPPANGVIFLHSAAQSIFAGSCGERYPPSDALAEIYAKGSGYPFKEHFTAYPVTGSAVDWLARVGIPAIEVELTNHQDLDWKQNLGGILLALEFPSK